MLARITCPPTRAFPWVSAELSRRTGIGGCEAGFRARLRPRGTVQSRTRMTRASARRRSTVRRVWLLVALLSLFGCGGKGSRSPTALSCQPYGSTPAPVAVSIGLGPVTAALAEETGVALFRACQLPSSVISDLTSGSRAATGMARGPNDGLAVWLVQVDATITEPSPGGRYQSHFLIEVNQATGMPTIVGQG